MKHKVKYIIGFVLIIASIISGYIIAKANPEVTGSLFSTALWKEYIALGAVMFIGFKFIRSERTTQQ